MEFENSINISPFNSKIKNIFCLVYIFGFLNSVYRKHLCDLTSDIICLALKAINNILSWIIRTFAMGLQ